MSFQSSIIYEDNHLIAVNKRSGVLVQGDKTEDRHLGDMIKGYIKSKYDKPGDVFLGTIHRLDRPTSGAVIFAKTSKALERMNKLFESRKVHKTYYTICSFVPEPNKATLKHYLSKDRARNTVNVSKSSRGKGYKEAVLTYDLMLTYGNRSFLKVHPETGRGHQIRAQLAHIGNPILGDMRYGATKPLDNAAIALHCYSMEFIHPVKKEKMIVKAKLPKTYPWTDFDIR